MSIDECALANPNRCKVEIGLMQEGSARAGIIFIGGIFSLIMCALR